MVGSPAGGVGWFGSDGGGRDALEGGGGGGALGADVGEDTLPAGEAGVFADLSDGFPGEAGRSLGGAVVVRERRARSGGVEVERL